MNQMNQMNLAAGELERIIEETMCYVKFSVRVLGFTYIREILVMALTGKDKHFFIQEHYYHLASIFYSTPERVKNAMRNSVKQANRYGMMERLNELFGKKVVETQPSVNDVIYYMLMILRKKTGIYPDYSAMYA